MRADSSSSSKQQTGHRGILKLLGDLHSPKWFPVSGRVEGGSRKVGGEVAGACLWLAGWLARWRLRVRRPVLTAGANLFHPPSPPPQSALPIIKGVGSSLRIVCAHLPAWKVSHSLVLQTLPELPCRIRRQRRRRSSRSTCATTRFGSRVPAKPRRQSRRQWKRRSRGLRIRQTGRPSIERCRLTDRSTRSWIARRGLGGRTR